MHVRRQFQLLLKVRGYHEPDVDGYSTLSYHAHSAGLYAAAAATAAAASSHLRQVVIYNSSTY